MLTVNVFLVFPIIIIIMVGEIYFVKIFLQAPLKNLRVELLFFFPQITFKNNVIKLSKCCNYFI
jgi:hypothetical protein